jgi:hypothetical protein
MRSVFCRHFEQANQAGASWNWQSSSSMFVDQAADKSREHWANRFFSDHLRVISGVEFRAHCAHWRVSIKCARAAMHPFLDLVGWDPHIRARSKD